MAISRYDGPIKLVLFDVDGVLTDGVLHIDDQGEVFKDFNVRDGLAVSLLKSHGIRSGVISGKSSTALDFRIRQLNFDLAVTGRLEKLKAYEEIKRDLALSDAQIAFVGDDVIDLPLVGVVGRFYAPADAHPLVRQSADYITLAAGGHGVAREVAEQLLTETGLTLSEVYEPLINRWSHFDVVQ